MALSPRDNGDKKSILLREKEGELGSDDITEFQLVSSSIQDGGGGKGLQADRVFSYDLHVGFKSECSKEVKNI